MEDVPAVVDVEGESPRETTAPTGWISLNLATRAPFCLIHTGAQESI